MFRDAQSGSDAPQSAHLSLPNTFLNRIIGLSIFTLMRCCWKLLVPRAKLADPSFFFDETSSLIEISELEDISEEPQSLVALGSDSFGPAGKD